MLNKDELKGNWEKLKGTAKQKWAMLGDKDLELYKEGKRDEFIGRIQAAYGKTKDAVEKEVDEFEKSCGCSSSDKAA